MARRAAGRPGVRPGGGLGGPLGRRPLAGPQGVVGEVRRLLVDGRNLQGAMSRTSVAGSVPDRALVASVLAAAPPEAQIELVLDGYPSGGVVGRVGPRLRLEFTKGRTADERIAQLVEAAARELGPIGIDDVLVISDDREVRDQARFHGARVEGTAWLTARIGSRGGIGQGRAIRHRE